MSDLTHADLVRLAAAGDEESARRLYEAYGPFVGNIARYFARPGEDADDVAQEVWLRLLQDRWRLDPDDDRGDLYGFLTTITRYCTWYLRDRSRYANHRQIDDGIVRVLQAAHSDPIDGLVDEQQTAVLRWALRTLSQRDRDLLAGRYRDGLTCRELAARHGRSMQTIAERLARIHQQLAATCGVQYRPVRKGQYARDVAYRHRPYGQANRRLPRDGSPSPRTTAGDESPTPLARCS